MKKFIVRQTVEIDLQWVVEAEDRDDAREKAWDGKFDHSKVVDIQTLPWDRPWDIEDCDEEPRYLSEDAIAKWREINVL